MAMVWLNMEIKICNTAIWGDKIIIVKNTNSLILLSGKEGKSSEKKCKNLDLSIIWRIPLLQVYLGHYIAKWDPIFKDICYRQRAEFYSVCFPSGLFLWTCKRVIWRTDHAYLSLLLLLLLLLSSLFTTNFSLWPLD